MEGISRDYFGKLAMDVQGLRNTGTRTWITPRKYNDELCLDGSQDSQIRGFHCEQAVLGGTKYLWRGQLAMSHFGEAPKVVPAKKAKKVGDVLPKVRS